MLGPVSPPHLLFGLMLFLNVRRCAGRWHALALRFSPGQPAPATPKPMRWVGAGLVLNGLVGVVGGFTGFCEG